MANENKAGSDSIPLSQYYRVRLVDIGAPIFKMLGNLESRLLQPQLEKLAIERPIFICGLFRAGTSITLKILSEHPSVATHRILDRQMPYLPYVWERITASWPTTPPVERPHKDGLTITNRTPEAVEEILWNKFFDVLHDEECSNILDQQVSNPAFEQFYRDHIKKLLWSRGRKRYVTKNNYSVTRMAYLQRLFPDAKFLIIIRNPVNHIASIIKTNQIYCNRERSNPRHQFRLQAIGHFELGNVRRCINIGNTALVREIWQRWREGEKVRGWAMYWASIYGFIADQLEAEPTLAKASLVIKHENLCHTSGTTLDRIITHTELSTEAFAPIRACYVKKLRPPDYYTPDFSPEELKDIAELTGTTAARFGYSL